jgi:hypothetical protein
MHVWVTVPRSARDLGGLGPELRKRWALAAKYAGAKLDFVEARSGEIHGGLLTRIWYEARDDDDPDQVFSEIDFIPRRQGLVKLAEIQAGLIAAHYVTRIPDARGALHKHELPDGVPLCGAWFIAFKRELCAEPAADWLGPGGPFNDAGNLAIQKYLEAGNGLATVHMLRGTDDAPLTYGTRYPHLGRHLFYGSSLEKPTDQVICFPGTEHPLTAGQVQEAARTVLKIL